MKVFIGKPSNKVVIYDKNFFEETAKRMAREDIEKFRKRLDAFDKV